MVMKGGGGGGVNGRGLNSKVYLTSPRPSEIGHNSFISQPILKPLTPVDSS